MIIARHFWHVVLVSVTLAFVLVGPLKSATVSGRVVDGQTKEPLPGVRVALVGTGKGAISGLDGTFLIKSSSQAQCRLKFTYSGYRDTTLQLDLASDGNLSGIEVGISRLTGKDQEVIITGSVDHGSDASSQQAVRVSDNVINTVSARTIEVSPDVSVADVSQRLAGVSIARTSVGDAQYAIIRGMNKRYNYTTVNGIKIPSPDNKNRYVPLDIFPSELLDRLEVTKSLLPSMEGDAIGGAMNLVMKHAPNREILTAQVASGYDGLFFDRKFATWDATSSNRSPRVENGDAYKATLGAFPISYFTPHNVSPSPNIYSALTYGNRFGENEEFGMILSGTYQSSSRGANTVFFQTDVAQDAVMPIPTDLELRTYSTLQQRSGLTGNLDYKLDDNNSLTLFGMYARLNKQELRTDYDTTVSLGYPKSIRLTTTIRATDEQQGIGNFTLGGTHKIFGKDLEANWNVAYSSATLNQPDRSELQLYGGSEFDSASGLYKNNPNIVNHGTRRWTYSIDQDKSVYLNLKTTEDIGGTPIVLTYGGMYRNKARTSSYDEYKLEANNGSTIQYYNGDITKDTFYVANPLGTPQDFLNYDAHENIAAGFGQAKVQIGNLTVIGGVRFEQTTFGWTSQIDPNLYDGKTGELTYLDVLPSLSLKYSPSEQQNWRASFFKSISRPGFFEVIPNQGVPGDDYTEYTNDSLNRTQAMNFDLRWEYFPGGLDQLLIGGFYKHLQDPIEYAVEYVKTSVLLRPQNFGDATNYGFEIDFRKYFSDFGVQGNYTYTNSQITTDKQVKYRDTDPAQTLRTRMEPQTRPLEGQSAHIGSLGLLYKNFESGTDAQLSAVYTGPAITAVSFYKDLDVWQKGYVQLDFSGEQRIAGNLTLYLKISNLLDAAHDEVIHYTYDPKNYGNSPMSSQVAGQDVLVRHELFDRNYILGLRFKL